MTSEAEAGMASEATKMAFRGNVHMDIRVINVSDIKFEDKLDHWHCPGRPKSIGPLPSCLGVGGHSASPTDGL